ncbi:MAG: FkbM family methyltransferase [Saprospiraceae bacterium]|nr:FkbM family methyltransferase [Saprospiraceae bacterium]
MNLNKFSVLKIDVEGAEWEVVKSFYPAIEKCKPIILMEILPVYSEQHVNRMERQKEIIQILHHLDYSVFRVVKKWTYLLIYLK